ncbi:hypothetical protein V6N13_054750 [Hibiscus sabdariffa]
MTKREITQFLKHFNSRPCKKAQSSSSSLYQRLRSLPQVDFTCPFVDFKSSPIWKKRKIWGPFSAKRF